MGHNFQMMLGTITPAFAQSTTAELARILRTVASQIEGGMQDGIARDLYGRVVGCFSLDIED